MSNFFFDPTSLGKTSCPKKVGRSVLQRSEGSAPPAYWEVQGVDSGLRVLNCPHGVLDSSILMDLIWPLTWHLSSSGIGCVPSEAVP